MKKLLVLTMIVIVVALALVSCGKNHVHSFSEWEIVENPTCNESGTEARYCTCGEKQTNDVPATNEHTEVVDAAVAPTCTEAGLTEGKHCAFCNLVIVAQTPVDATGHTEVIDAAVPASCTEAGLTEGKHCSVCKEVLVKQGVEPIVAHTYDDKYDESCNVCGGTRDAECAHTTTEPILGYAATCTEPGLTDGQKCKKCGEVLIYQTSIDAKGHTEVLDEAIPATCTEAGLTQGKHCSACSAVLIKQTTIPTLPHTYGEWVVTKNANCGQDGEMARYCTCGAKQTEVIYGAGMHTEITDFAVEPTCATTGLTEGKHCSYCGTVLVQQTVIPTLEHVYNTTYSFDNSFHWFACKGCGAEKDKAEHQVADDGACNICKHSEPTVGIIYDKSADGTYAEVVGYEGTAKKIRIADTYEGLPVKTIYDQAFYTNYTITSVIIPDSVTSIGSGAFSVCDSLTSVIIPDSVTTIGNYAFSWCYSLTSVVIGDSVTSVGKGAFESCIRLTSIIIPDSVTSIGSNAFDWCPSLTSIDVDDNNQYYKSIDGNLYSKDGKTLMQYAIGKQDSSFVIPDSVTSIGNGAFRYCDSLTSVVIGDSVTSIGEWAFYKCSGLTSVVIGDSVTSIDDRAFSDCDSLTSVVIPDSVTSIGSMAFYNCSALKDVYYTGSEEEWAKITIDSSNSYLTSVTIHYNYVPEN